MPSPAPGIVEQAAQWHARMHSGDAWTAAQQQAFEAWLHTSEHHARTWQRMQALWQRFDASAGADGACAAAAITAGLGAGDRRCKALRRSGGGALALLLAGGATWLALQSDGGRYLLADHRSPAGVVTQIELPDRSRLTLGSGSAVNVRYAGGVRRIELVRGDVLAEVVAEAPTAEGGGGARPFLVETPQGTAEALGTRYLVSHRADGQAAGTRVTVMSSTVRACARPAAPAAAGDCAVLAAGQGAHLTGAGRLQPMRPADVDAAGAWTRGQLVVDDQPLPEVLRELARHHRGLLSFDEAELAHIRVSGVFDLRDTDRSLQALADTTGVRLRRTSPWTASVHLKPPR